MTTKIDT